MKKAVIMCRVSSDEQAKGYSLDIQFESLTNYCNRNNYTVQKHYREDYSAKDFNRPEFQNFLQYAKKNKGKIDFLLVTSWDRFSRNLTDALVMLRSLKKLGIEVQAIEQPIDMSIPENKAMFAIFLAIPEIDNDRRSIKIKGGMRAALKSGRWCRRAPIGYENARDEENKPLIIPSEKAVVIKFVFEQIKKGKTQAEIRNRLYKEGKNISKTTLSSLLRNPVYIGQIRVPALEEEEEVLVDGVHNGIISDKLFYEVQEILSGRKKKRNTPSYYMLREELPLRGILYCSKCEGKMTGSKSRSRNGDYHHYYHCNYCRKERYPAKKVNNTIVNILEDFSFTNSVNTLYKKAVKQIIGGDKTKQDRRKTNLQESIQSTNKRIEKLQDIYIDGDIDQNSYNDSMLRYKTIKQENKEELERLSKTDHLYKEWLKRGVNYFSNLKGYYKTLSVEAKQQLLCSIFPEKFDFDGNKCRTTRVNEVLRYILQIDSELTKHKRGQLSQYLELSSLVELGGIEPPSKQGIK